MARGCWLGREGEGGGGRESLSRCFFPRQQREAACTRGSITFDRPYFRRTTRIFDENKFGGVDEAR